MSKKLHQTRAKYKKRSGGEKVLFSVVFILFLALALSYIFAFVWIISGSLKDSFEFAIGSVFDIPKQLKWENYYQAITTLEVNGTGFLGMWWNTLWLTVGRSVLSLLSTCMCAYAYARYDFPGRKLLYVFSIIMMTLSIPSGGAAAYRLYSDWGLKNSPLFLVGATNGLGTLFIIFTGFYRGISWEYCEAAFIDGASDFAAWRRVVLPQAMPLIGVNFINSIVAGLQDYSTTMLYMTEYPSIAYGLYEYEASCVRAMNYPIYYAGLIMVAIPGILIFVLMKEKIIENMNIGGLKG